ncbi:hypothetical protein AAG570_000573 [Ranatra chinensis]|uniref:Uncharacterized protein n=1 Tax=Ranatra chinensis TaxID=642074 RepID=A0ABD0YXG0_9HEMI
MSVPLELHVTPFGRVFGCGVACVLLASLVTRSVPPLAGVRDDRTILLWSITVLPYNLEQNPRAFVFSLVLSLALQNLLSECYFAGKGAAVVLPPHDRLPPPPQSPSPGNLSSSDIQQHLQSMFYLLRPEETLKMPVSLRKNNGSKDPWRPAVLGGRLHSTREQTGEKADVQGVLSSVVLPLLPGGTSLWKTLCVRIGSGIVSTTPLYLGTCFGRRRFQVTISFLGRENGIVRTAQGVPGDKPGKS